jgi:ABC-type multidrug transport system ATPase subunit
MDCDDAVVEMNRLSNNSVGAFLMYSRNLRLNNNFISDNRGPSGYGIGIKDIDDGIIRDNLFAGNRIGAALDNSPRQIDSSMIFEGNVFSFNDIGVRFTPSVRRNQFKGNSFTDNQQQVSIAGSGTLQDNYWTIDGVGNYWSDYAGFDANQDGFGDIPYKSEKLFENLMDKHPELRLFLYSPAAQSVDFAARALPMVKPQPILVDDAPLMNMRLPAHLPVLPEESPSNIGVVSGGLLGLLLMLFLLPRLSIRHKFMSRKTNDSDDFPIIQIEKLTKRFNSTTIVDELNLSITGGESVAMWGSNGAGKTTIIRCLLGLLEYEGSIKVNGLDLNDNGKAIRSSIGYVPQELNLHEDLTVIDTMNFYSHLRKADKDSIETLMGDMELVEHSQKQVKQLSGGMKQRLALALALLSDPPILILDEPTASLDTHSRESFLLRVSELKKAGKTLIFASHRTSDILNLADRVIVLEHGQIINESIPSQMKQQVSNKLTLHIHFLENQLKDASNLLQNQGFDVDRNGSSISIAVAAEEKTRLLSILINAGISVMDFDIERSN